MFIVLLNPPNQVQHQRDLPQQQQLHYHPQPRLPVKGGRVSLGLAAEHHLFAILAMVEREHHAAGLFGEHGPQLDCTSWKERPH